jgi:cytochrome c oxidase subunit II
VTRGGAGHRRTVSFVAAAQGDTRGEYDGVASLYLPIALVVAAVVLGAMAYAVVRYRARPGRVPRPTREHKPLEIGMAALLCVIVAVLVVVTFASQSRIEAAPPRTALRIDVVSFRWGWEFRYPGLGGVRSVSGPARPAILRVPEGALVHFRITSRDVIHAFWIPELKFKHDLFPGRRDSFDLRFPRAATFLGGRCAVFCGLQHADMRFSVAVMPRADFDAWIASRRGAQR